MKRSLQLTGLIAILVLITRCQKELSGDVGGNDKKCVNCDYLPVCDSSLFVYVDEVGTQADTNRNVVRILKDSLINGKKFTAITTFGFFDSGAWYNCDNGDYQTIIATADLGINPDSLINVLLGGFPIPPGTINFPKQITLTLLKSNAAAGTTWKDEIYKLSVPPVLNFSVSLDSKLVEKLPAKTVFGKNYTDVLHVQSKLNVVSSPAGNIPLDYSLDIFYARGVGIIEGASITPGGGGIKRKLFSYQLK
jgi:hypothetical protein